MTQVKCIHSTHQDTCPTFIIDNCLLTHICDPCDWYWLKLALFIIGVAFWLQPCPRRKPPSRGNFHNRTYQCLAVSCRSYQLENPSSFPTVPDQFMILIAEQSCLSCSVILVELEACRQCLLAPWRLVTCERHWCLTLPASCLKSDPSYGRKHCEQMLGSIFCCWLLPGGSFGHRPLKLATCTSC